MVEIGQTSNAYQAKLLSKTISLESNSSGLGNLAPRSLCVGIIPCAMREPVIVPVRDPVMVPVRDPVMVPVRAVREPVMVPPKETVAIDSVISVAITVF